MRDNYDFSKGVRGKFNHPDPKLRLPIYLDDELLEYYTAKSAELGANFSAMINSLLTEIMKTELSENDG